MRSLVRDVPIAPCDRPPRSDGLKLQAGFRALESSELIARTDSAPSRALVAGPVAQCRVQHSTTVAGAAPDFTGFPILPPVNDEQAPSAHS